MQEEDRQVGSSRDRRLDLLRDRRRIAVESVDDGDLRQHVHATRDQQVDEESIVHDEDTLRSVREDVRLVPLWCGRRLEDRFVEDRAHLPACALPVVDRRQRRVDVTRPGRDEPPAPPPLISAAENRGVELQRRVLPRAALRRGVDRVHEATVGAVGARFGLRTKWYRQLPHTIPDRNRWLFPHVGHFIVAVVSDRPHQCHRRTCG